MIAATRWGLLIPAAIVAFASCGGEEPPPPPRTADRITLATGGGQNARVGEALPLPIQFIASDAQGPLPGVTVSFVLNQAGFLSAASAVTNAAGVAEVRWTVGGRLGTQTLSASVPGGVPPATAAATVLTGPVALLTPVSEANQFVVVGGSVPSAPAVRVTDAFGNPIAGEAVTFVDATGRSTVAGSPATSGSDGRAALAGWTIGRAAGSYALTAATGNGSSTNFVAFGIPALVQVSTGVGQSANAGTALAVPPAVVALDDQSQPLPGVGVTFAVVSGGGRLLGSGLTATAANGVATAPSWILGPTPGPNTLTATVPGIPAIEFSATGVIATPAAAAAASPSAVTGIEGNFGPARPTVRVTDPAGRPVAGTPVQFSLVSGGGTISAGQPVTDFDGQAQLGFWRFGTGPQSLTATAGSLPPVTFSATTQPAPPSDYEITVRFLGTQPTPSQRTAFEDAAAKWATLILGDLPDEVFTPADDLSFCGGQPLDEVIDDLLIFAQLQDIDGPGGVLGQAGACYLRDVSLHSVVGIMRFDVADVVGLESSDRFRDVVLHEMGHVIGLGSIWNLKGLITGRGTGDPFFTGQAAQMAFLAAAATPAAFTGSVVPVENTGGGGTRDVHWRESVISNELMTGFLNTGVNPLSAITVASFGDEGYLVNDAASDAFTFGAALRAATQTPTALHTLRWPTQVRIRDRTGRVTRVLDPGAGPFPR